MADEEIRAAFSEWLKGKLDELGWNYSRLAREVGVRESNARSWVTGSNLPDWHKCRVLGDVLGVPREEVRRRRGYIDPDAPVGDPMDERRPRLLALVQDFDAEELDTLLHIATLQRAAPRHTREGRRR